MGRNSIDFFYTVCHPPVISRQISIIYWQGRLRRSLILVIGYVLIAIANAFLKPFYSVKLYINNVNFTFSGEVRQQRTWLLGRGSVFLRTAAGKCRRRAAR